MATRRPHNKSRLGCNQCKKRRIKCDGTHPVCNNCTKRGLECGFRLLAPSSTLSTSIVASSSKISDQEGSGVAAGSLKPIRQTAIFRQRSRSSEIREGALGVPTSAIPNPRSPALPVPAPPRLLPSIVYNVWKDRRERLPPRLQPLLDHYEQTTRVTLSGNDPAKTAWRFYIPELANDHQYLTHGVLAVASLHLNLLHESPDMKLEMRKIAADQMDRALALYRPEIGKVREKNASALFACATLLVVYFFRTSIMDIEETLATNWLTLELPPDAVDQILHAVMRAIHGLRGAFAVLMPGWRWIATGKLRTLALRKWWPKNRVPASDRALDEDRRLCELESLWIRPGRDYEPYFDELTEALAILRETFALTSQVVVESGVINPGEAIPYAYDDVNIGMLKDRGAVLQWAVRVRREFITLIEEKNVEALVLMGYWAILPARIRHIWWLEGLGAGILTAVVAALGPENRHLVEWPASIIGVDLNTLAKAPPPGDPFIIPDFEAMSF